MTELVINMNRPHEIECGMCDEIENQDNQDDRKCVPFSNGEPVTSDSACDGYLAVCGECYAKWDSWDNEKLKGGAA